ncbi:hypothetical protein MAR_007220 [Mya arenaria]|uniref:Uncharacterized protein n=1 Tax=Mya arenaria TaxID=6604 RepID=A0ABY7DBQ3_MYAAR|nr:hypothetical protein MAR_007220 [Mya arenaria]
MNFAETVSQLYFNGCGLRTNVYESTARNYVKYWHTHWNAWCGAYQLTVLPLQAPAFSLTRFSSYTARPIS